MYKGCTAATVSMLNSCAATNVAKNVLPLWRHSDRDNLEALCSPVYDIVGD